MSSKKLIKLPEDVRGLKLRVPNAPTAAAVDALGGSGVILAASELYLGIQRGTVDGCFGTTSSISEGQKMYEVANYWTRMVISVPRYGVLVNLNVWNSLAPQQQQVLIQATKDYYGALFKTCSGQEDQIWAEIAKQPHVEVYTVPTADVAKFSALTIPASQKLLAQKIPAADLANYMQLLKEAK